MRQGCLIHVPYFQGHGADTCKLFSSLSFLSVLAGLGLRCSEGLSLLVESGGCPAVAVNWFLLSWQIAGSRTRGLSSCG